MKIVVIGGSGLIGRKLVDRLRQRGHEAMAASPSSGVDTMTGQGLAEALAGAQVVVDVANSPSFQDEAVNGTVEIADPERLPLAEFVRRFLKAKQDPRIVIEDIDARYFGAALGDKTLVPGGNPRVGPTHFEGWLGQQRIAA